MTGDPSTADTRDPNAAGDVVVVARLDRAAGRAVVERITLRLTIPTDRPHRPAATGPG